MVTFIAWIVSIQLKQKTNLNFIKFVMKLEILLVSQCLLMVLRYKVYSTP